MLVLAQTGNTLEPNSTRRSAQGVQANPVLSQQATTASAQRPEQSQTAAAAPSTPQSVQLPKTPIVRRAPGLGETTETNNAPRNPIGTTLGILCLLLAGVYGLLRLLRRYGPQRFSTPSSPLIQLLDRMRLDPQSTIYVLRVGRRVVVTGSSPAGMNQLAEIADPEEVAELCRLQPPDEGNPNSLTSLFSGVRPIRREMKSADPISVHTDSAEHQTAPHTKPGANREACHA